jgi:hypothetical protein
LLKSCGIIAVEGKAGSPHYHALIAKKMAIIKRTKKTLDIVPPFLCNSHHYPPLGRGTM